jgi:hypothetical protein
VPFLVFGLIGTSTALIYWRWRINGLFVAGIAALFVIGALVVLVTWQDRWAAIGHWLAAQTPLGLFVGWPMLVALALTGSGYLLIRRATP